LGRVTTFGRRAYTSVLWRSRPLFTHAGWDLRPVSPHEEGGYPPDFDDADRALYEVVKPYTLTPPERVWALRKAVQYIVARGIEGDIVECGVWRGGSMMAAAQTLLDLGDTDRRLHLFDTYTGMTTPTGDDVMYDGSTANDLMPNAERGSRLLADAALEDVKANLALIPYPPERIHFVEGPVEETIPAAAPEAIALLRLDTDWYESTKHELEHLFPRLSVGGVLIIDDYGHWLGARRAVDEYLVQNDVNLLLTRVDYTARMALKL
jgi:hypothetical protein